MKKILLVMVILSMVLCACNEKKTNDVEVTNNETQKNEEIESNEPVKDIEYTKPDFTDNTDFKINTSSEVDEVSFEKIVLHDESNAQLDLGFPDDKVGTLIVSKQEIIFDEEEASTFSIGNEEVSRYKAVDGMNHYIWKKDNFYFELISESEFSDEEIAKVVVGYSAQVGASD